MDQEQLGSGYFRFNLPERPNKGEADRIDEIFRTTLDPRRDSTGIKECFIPSRSFWKLYGDCIEEHDESGTPARPVVCCRGRDAEFLQTMLGVFRKATAEIETFDSTNDEVDSSIPALVNAHLRAIIPRDQLSREPRFEKAQSKDIARRQTSSSIG
jgi:hypothetical protein